MADWLSRFGPHIAGHDAEGSWAETLVCDSTELDWTNPRTGVTQQLFAVLAVWGYPAGSASGRLWALRAVPSDTKVAWKQLLRASAGGVRRRQGHRPCGATDVTGGAPAPV
ncbi:MAG: hypothetical protein M0Z63_06070 [Actinomycetota bacterium]|nr:hypothetical protein [Actinomycetota bacterium]